MVKHQGLTPGEATDVWQDFGAGVIIPAVASVHSDLHTILLVAPVVWLTLGTISVHEKANNNSLIQDPSYIKNTHHQPFKVLASRPGVWVNKLNWIEYQAACHDSSGKCQHKTPPSIKRQFLLMSKQLFLVVVCFFVCLFLELCSSFCDKPIHDSRNAAFLTIEATN